MKKFMRFLQAIITVLALFVLMIIYMNPANYYDPAAGYSDMYGGDVLHDYSVDIISPYVIKGIRL